MCGQTGAGSSCSIPSCVPGFAFYLCKYSATKSRHVLIQVTQHKYPLSGLADTVLYVVVRVQMGTRSNMPFIPILIILVAGIFQRTFSRLHEREDLTVLPGFGIHLRVVDRNFVRHVLTIRAPPPLNHVQRIAKRMCETIQPRPLL